MPVLSFIFRSFEFVSSRFIGIELSISDFSLPPDCFMQNKPNFQNAQINVTSFITKDYGNISNWKLGENKPNQTQFPRPFPVESVRIFLKEVL